MCKVCGRYIYMYSHIEIFVNTFLKNRTCWNFETKFKQLLKNVIDIGKEMWARQKKGNPESINMCSSMVAFTSIPGVVGSLCEMLIHYLVESIHISGSSQDTYSCCNDASTSTVLWKVITHPEIPAATTRPKSSLKWSPPSSDCWRK